MPNKLQQMCRQAGPPRLALLPAALLGVLAGAGWSDVDANPAVPPAVVGMCASDASAKTDLWQHLRTAGDLGDLRDLQVEFTGNTAERVLRLSPTAGSGRYQWVCVPPPQQGWDLSRREAVQAEIANRGPVPVTVMLWVVGGRSWGAVPDGATLEPGQSRTHTCNLRRTFGDLTPVLDPNRIAALWKGMHMCQHWDGDGGGAGRATALERARRFRGRSVFYTDNDRPALRSFLAEANMQAFVAQSNLHAHDCAMFLDDRPSTRQLREWFRELTADATDGKALQEKGKGKSAE